MWFGICHESGNEPSPTWLRPRKSITRPLKTETHFGDEAARIMSRCPASLHTLGNLSIRLRNFRSYGDRQPSRRGLETHWQISSNQNPELNQSKSESCCVTIGATVIANHHGVDAKHRTVQALCARARFAVSDRKPSRRGRETPNGTDQNPGLNQNESDPDFLGVTIACPSMTAGSSRGGPMP